MKEKLLASITAVLFCFSCCFPAVAFAYDEEETQKYIISGIVMSKEDESPIKNVELRITGDITSSVKSDVFGYYRTDEIDSGTYLEIIPLKKGMTFSPKSFRIASLTSNRTINFTASKNEAPAEKPEQKQSASIKDEQELASPPTGVVQPQPVYVAETKSLFAEEKESAKKTSSPNRNKTSFNLSGKVVYYASGLVGVRVMLNDNRKFMTSTDINGYYSFEGLKAGEEYTIKFSKEGYAFTPEEYKITDTSKDITVDAKASVSRYKIQGKVSEGLNNIENVNIKIVSGNDAYNVTTDRDGFYEIDNLEYGKNYSVTPTKEGVMITPPRVLVNKLGSDRTINFNAVVQKFSIKGTVKDFDGEHVKNAKVEFETTFDTFKVVTDSKGRYEIKEVPMALTYIVTASREGYEPSEPYLLETLDKDREINFQLKPIVKKEKSQKTAKATKGISEKEKAKKDREEKKKREEANKLELQRLEAQAKIDKENKMKEEKQKLKAEREQFERERFAKQQRLAEEKKQKAEDEKLRLEREKRENERKIKEEKEKIKSERENLERKRIAEQKRLAEEKRQREEEEKQRIERERLEQKRIAEQERMDRLQKEEEEKQAKLDRKKAAELEKIEKKQKEELKAQEKKLQIEREKLEQKRIAQQEREDKLRKEEEERQSKLEQKRIAEQEESEKRRKEEEKKLKEEEEKKLKEEKRLKEERNKLERERLAEQEKIKKEKREKKDDEERKKREAQEAAVKEENKEVSTASSKAKTVKVKGKIESGGIPLSDITVKMSHEFSTKTDEKGRYELTVPAGRRYSLTPEASDFYFEPQEVVFENLKSNQTQDFAPYISIEGEVFAEGKGIEGVQINLNGVQKAVTSQFGRYKIDKIEYGIPVVVSAFKEGISFYPDKIEFANADKNVDYANFEASFSISGRVAIQGSGLGAAQVDIEVTGSTDTVVKTDFRGNYTVLGAVQGGTIRITPKAGGYYFEPQSRDFDNIRESFAGQNFTAIKETYTISGSVSVGEKPIKNAVVSISKRALKYYTDDRGTFVIAGLDYGGPYTLNVLSKEHEFEPIVIDVLEKDTTVEFSTDISLSGRVLSGGKPVEGVIVDVNGKKHKTDANGKYLVKGLKYNGDYLLTFSAPGILFSPLQKEYHGVKKSVLNETVNAYAVINGRVTHSDGKPFQGAQLKLSGDSAVYKSDANGYYLIKDIELGRDYELEVSAAGYKFEPSRREYKKLANGKMSENFKAFSASNASQSDSKTINIKGVVKSGGQPLKKVSVIIEGTSKKQTMTNEKGEFSFENLATNKRYELTVISKSHDFKKPTAIIENPKTDIFIELEPGKVAVPDADEIAALNKEYATETDEDSGEKKNAKNYYRVSGKITEDGKPLKGVKVLNQDRESVAETNASGEYYINLEAGESTDIIPSFQGYAFSPQKYSVSKIKAASSNMNFTARSNMHVLSGRVLTKDLKGLKSVSIKDVNSNRDFLTDSRGAYKIPGLFHRMVSMIIPEASGYNFYPENMEISLEKDFTANDIYAYPRKPKQPEAFVSGGIDSAVNKEENYVSVVLISPDGGKVSVIVKNDKNSVMQKNETTLASNIASVVTWDGEGSPEGNYTVELNGAGFDKEILKFKIF